MQHQRYSHFAAWFIVLVGLLVAAGPVAAEPPALSGLVE